MLTLITCRGSSKCRDQLIVLLLDAAQRNSIPIAVVDTLTGGTVAGTSKPVSIPDAPVLIIHLD